VVDEERLSARAGPQFTLRSTPMPNWDGIINCEVLVVDPPKTLAYTWSSLGVATKVTMTLTPTASGVTLRVEQSGFPAGGDQYVQGATYGWQRFIGNLERLLGSAKA
jgi:uncharacterized protein YndB with AHSA1/START domain